MRAKTVENLKEMKGGLSTLGMNTFIRDSGRHLKRALRALRGRELWRRAQVRRDTLRLGNEGARWSLCPTRLTKESVVYSIGVGEEISFDLELIRQFGVRVHAFDPTPRSIEWLRKQNLPPEFVFHPFGVASFDGTCKFSPPVNPAHISHTILERDTPWPSIDVPVRRLRTIMDSLGHDTIDLLKMDIEGAEYSVLADMLSSGIHAEQLLVEFHHRWPEVGVGKTRRALRDLSEAGYRIFYVSPSGEDYSFVRLNHK